jgi:hypothetical protein
MTFVGTSLNSGFGRCSGEDSLENQVAADVEFAIRKWRQNDFAVPKLQWHHVALAKQIGFRE